MVPGGSDRFGVGGHGGGGKAHVAETARGWISTGRFSVPVRMARGREKHRRLSARPWPAWGRG
jgi:hypothetical protein